MGTLTRKTSKDIATVKASNRKVHVTTTDSLTIEESRELRKLLKAAEKAAGEQKAGLSFGGFLAAEKYRYVV